MSKPLVSIIVPVYNAEKTVASTLPSIISQKCSYPYETIVVDDGSNDNTAEVVEDFIRNSKNPEVIKLIKAHHGGPAAARNIGVRHAVGEIILFIDSDCVANEKWIDSLVDVLLQDLTIAGVSGTYRTLNTNSMTARFVGYDIAYRHQRMGKYIDHVGTYSAAFRKAALLRVGLFDEFFRHADGEDNDISYRLINSGYKLVFQPQVWVSHIHPSTIGRYLKGQFRRAYWRAALYMKHRERIRKPDTYTSWQTQLQPVIWISSALLSVLLFAFSATLVFFPLVFSFISIGLLNLGFILWTYPLEKSLKFLVFSFALCVLRSLAWVVGGVFGIFKFARGLKGS